MYKVLEIALDEVGYLEKASNNSLDSKLSNAGKNNYTKFARDLDNIPGFYNGKKQGAAWCDVFVDWCFVQAYGATKAREMLYQPEKSLGAGCLYSANYFKAAGRFFNSPKVGDQIFFTKNGKIVHTGLVYAIDTSFVYTVEGNTSSAAGVIENGGCVAKKYYRKTSSYIYGYGRPDYDLVQVQPTPKPVTGGIDVKLNTLKKGSKGGEVKSLQSILIAKFRINCGAAGPDGDFGTHTEKAVRLFQERKKLKVDGVVGSNTWRALLE